MLDLNVCIGSSCHLKGAYNVIQTFQQLVEAQGLHDKIEMKAQFCMKQCQNGVSVSFDGEVFSVSTETAKSFFEVTVLPRIQAETTTYPTLET